MDRKDIDTSIFYTMFPGKGGIYDDVTVLPFPLQVSVRIGDILPFFKENSIGDILSLLIELFKDKYPNCAFYFHDFFGEDYLQLNKVGNQITYKSTNLYRKDIEEVLWYYIIIEDWTDEVLYKRAVGFMEKIEITFRQKITPEMISSAFDGRFKKEVTERKATITASDSPIAKVTLEERKFIFEMNPAKYKSYEY